MVMVRIHEIYLRAGGRSENPMGGGASYNVLNIFPLVGIGLICLPKFGGGEGNAPYPFGSLGPKIDLPS